MKKGNYSSVLATLVLSSVDDLAVCFSESDGERSQIEVH